MLSEPKITTEIDPSDSKLIELLNRVPEERLQPIYERHGVECDQGIEMLVREISLDGSNSMASALRKWKGICYAQIVRDVAKKMKVKTNDDEEVPEIELKLLEELIRRYLDKASPEEREQIEMYLNEASKDYQQHMGEMVKGTVSVGSLALLVKRLGQHTVAEIVRWVVLRTTVTKVAGEAARRATHIAGWAIPFLNVFLVGWTVADIAGPAYRKTIPTVLEVALLRLEYSP